MEALLSVNIKRIRKKLGIKVDYPLPDKKYQIIYADPPWKYRDSANAGKRGAAHKYSVMSVEDIKALPVAKIADDNCVLFIWSTNPMMPECLEVIKAWGFEYVTKGFTWVKLNKINPTTHMGMGHWTRGNEEPCWLAKKGAVEIVVGEGSCWVARKGSPKRKSASVKQVVFSPIRKHSQKPDEVRERIVELMGELPRIELFARKTYEGWDHWGDEI